MKINDKHLCALAIGSTAVDKQGFLYKRGEQNRTFQKRWFTLKGNLLFYFEKPSDREPIGVIVVQSCAVQVAENEELYAFELDFEGCETRTYVLGAETQEEMEDWMRALTSAGYEFMKLKLAELQQRLDELNVETEGTATVVFDETGAGSSGEVSLPSKAPSLSHISLSSVASAGISHASRPVALSDLEDRRVQRFKEMHEEFGKSIRESVHGAALHCMDIL